MSRVFIDVFRTHKATVVLSYATIVVCRVCIGPRVLYVIVVIDCQILCAFTRIQSQCDIIIALFVADPYDPITRFYKVTMEYCIVLNVVVDDLFHIGIGTVD